MTDQLEQQRALEKEQQELMASDLGAAEHGTVQVKVRWTEKATYEGTLTFDIDEIRDDLGLDPGDLLTLTDVVDWADENDWLDRDRNGVREYYFDMEVEHQELVSVKPSEVPVAQAVGQQALEVP